MLPWRDITQLVVANETRGAEHADSSPRVIASQFHWLQLNGRYLMNGASDKEKSKDFSLQNFTIYRSC